MRAFLAVPVAPPAHAGVGQLLSGLRSSVAGVRWVDPATVHITLHFFAELPSERVDEVIELMRPVASTTPPFSLRFGGLGSFPPQGRPRVLWLGLSGSGSPLTALTTRVQDTLGRNGFAVDRRPSHPHVTLGRPKAAFDVTAWRVETAGVPSPPGFTAAEIILYESSGGHQARARLPMTGAGVEESEAAASARLSR